MVFADRDGFIRIWNEAASKLLGYAPEQAIGRRVDLFIPRKITSFTGRASIAQSRVAVPGTREKTYVFRRCTAPGIGSRLREASASSSTKTAKQWLLPDFCGRIQPRRGSDTRLGKSW